MGKIINNTIYGSAARTGTGILINNFSSPTVMNNIIANTAVGISIDIASATLASPPDVTFNHFQNNVASGTTGTNSVIVAGNAPPLFLNTAANNFYLAPSVAGSPNQAIDSSLDVRVARTLYTNVAGPLGITQQDMFAPSADIYGQTRIADTSPTATFNQKPIGVGSSAFKDRGAIERADFSGPTAALSIVPDDTTQVPDNAANIDLDQTLTSFSVDRPSLLTKFIVTLTDPGTFPNAGVGVFDAQPGLVSGAAFTLRQIDVTNYTNPPPGRLLVQNVDYTFAYNANTNEAIFTSLTVFPSEARYNITLDQTQIIDTAGNQLQPNQLDGTTQFNILVTDGDNDPPVIALPLPPTTPEDIAITLSGANAIRITDADAFLNDGELQVVLTATNGTFSLNAAALAALDFAYNDAFGTGIGDGTGDALMRFRGTLVEVAAALDGLSFLPGPDVNDPLGTGLAPNDDIRLAIFVNDLGNYWVNPVNGLLDSPQTDTDVLHFIVTPVNDEPVFTLATANFTVNEDETAANIAALGQMLAINLGPGPVPTANDEYGQTLTYKLTAQTAGDTAKATAIFATGPTLTVRTGITATNAIAGVTSLTLSSVAQFSTLPAGPFKIQVGAGATLETLTVTIGPGNVLNLLLGTLNAHSSDELVTHSDLAFTLNTNANGFVNYNVVLTDIGLDAGTVAPGDNDNTSQTIPLTITVAPINDEPILTFNPTLAVGVGTGATTLTLNSVVPFSTATTPFTIQIDSGANVETLQVTAVNVGLNQITLASGTTVAHASGVLVTRIVNEDATAQTVPGYVTFNDGDPEPGVVDTWTSATIVSASSDRGWAQVGAVGAIFSAISINTANGTLTYTLMPDVNGLITVTVTATDSGLSAPAPNDNSVTTTFTLNVNPVNDKPAMTITGLNSPFHHQSNAVTAQGGQTEVGFATPDFAVGKSASAIDEVPPADPVTPQQVLSYNIVSGPDTIFGDLAFAAGPGGSPTINSAGTLTYTTATGAPTFGIAVVSVQVRDNGGTLNGGVDLGDPVDYYIAVGVLVLPTAYSLVVDNVTLILNAAQTELEIRNTASFATILQSYLLTDLTGGLLVRGNANANQITFDYTNGAPIPSTVGVILSGGLGADSIVLKNNVAAINSVVDTFSKPDQGVITVTDAGGPRVINYIQFESPITDSLVTSNRTFIFSGVNDDIKLTDDALAGVTTISSVLVGFATPTGLGATFTTGATATITVNAGTGNDILRVNSYDSTITTTSFNGNGGNDLLIGGTTNSFSISGSDAGTLNGAGRAFAEFESLQGGAGTDSFVFASTAGTISGTIDGIGAGNTLDYSAFGTGVTVNLATGAATNVFGAAALGVSNFATVLGGGGSDLLTGNAATASSLVGNAGGDTLNGGTAADTLSGLDGNDSLTGGAGNDSLLGGNNDDTLVDGSGDDNLDGGTGNDTYVLTPGSADVLTETGADTDVLDFSLASQGINSNATPFNLDSGAVQTVFGVHTVQLVGTFENFIGSSFDDFVRVTSNSVVRNVNGGGGSGDKLIGPDAVNTWNITGTNAGNIFNSNPTQFMTFSNVENLTGGTLADSFAYADGTFGIAGVIDAAGGNDTLSYAAYTAPLGGSVTVVLSAAGTGTATRTGGIISFETVIGGAGDDTLTGSTNPDSLVGNDGNDVISGGDGNDSLFGGLGGDTLSDGLGNDSLNGGDGDDRDDRFDMGGEDMR